MNFVMPDLYPASAEIFILVMALVVLLVDLFAGKGRRWRRTSGVCWRGLSSSVTCLSRLRWR